MTHAPDETAPRRAARAGSLTPPTKPDARAVALDAACAERETVPRRAPVTRQDATWTEDAAAIIIFARDLMRGALGEKLTR